MIAQLRRKPVTTKVKSKSNGKRKAELNDATEADPSDIQQPPPTIIFMPTAKLASYVAILLQHLHIRATALHSRLSQRQRLQALGLFRSSTIPVLVTTDVGARGLDIADVALVISWNVPQDAETYIHRVGRTARVGRVGMAVSFVCGEEDGPRNGSVSNLMSIVSTVTKNDF
jgi:ATP-dependent RNA helicase DDX49/DBP8